MLFFFFDVQWSANMSDPGDVHTPADPAWAATYMAAFDSVKKHYGMRIDLLEPGRAILSMTVREEMTNGFDITHGGIVFTLADTAFAYACNETAEQTVASGAEISFIRPTRLGDVLTAEAARRVRQGRNGIYDVTVTDQNGHIVAEYRGRSFTTDRIVADEVAGRA